MNILHTFHILCLLSAISAKNINTTSEPQDNKRILSEYERNKTNILRQESMFFLGGTLRLNDEEILVNNILMKLKEAEVNQSFYHPDKFNFTKHYFEYKDYIEQSKVYQIIKKMPKGAALHLHSTFVLDGDYLLNLTYEDHLYACYTGDNLKLRFSDTVPQRPCTVNWTLLSELRNATDNITAFDLKLKKFFTLHTKDEDNIRVDLHKVWKRFNSIHSSVKSLITYRPMREKLVYDTLQKFYDDNIMYAEIRSGMHIIHELNGTEYGPMYMIKLHRDVTQRFIEDHPDFIGMKFILTIFRKSKIEELKTGLNMTIELKTEFPLMVAGFDLVGQEDFGYPLTDFVPYLLEMKDKINYYFHAGETNWFGMSTDENLIDAVLLGSKRLGHGYALAKHPVLMSLIKKEDIAVEVNVISNAVLALVRDVRNHPLATFLSLGLPVVLSSDDPGLWGAEPLSHDFYISFIAVASKHADLRLLKQLAINSIRYSALENRRKTRLFKVFNRRWNAFLEEVIAENSCDNHTVV